MACRLISDTPGIKRACHARVVRPLTRSSSPKDIKRPSAALAATASSITRRASRLARNVGLSERSADRSDPQQARILDRDHGRCVLCGTHEDLTIGHLLSLEDGARLGAATVELYSDANLAAMCEDATPAFDTDREASMPAPTSRSSGGSSKHKRSPTRHKRHSTSMTRHTTPDRGDDAAPRREPVRAPATTGWNNNAAEVPKRPGRRLDTKWPLEPPTSTLRTFPSRSREQRFDAKAQVKRHKR